MKLILDIGNTRIKWRMAEFEGHVAHTLEGWDAQLIKAWQGLGEPFAVFAGSVASEQLNHRVMECVHKLWPQQSIIWLRSQASCCGVRIQYAEPQRFGIDRFAALVAARAEFADQPLIVLDAGTAITLDALDVNGLHLGGLIMPGLRLLNASLTQGVAQLSKNQLLMQDLQCAPQHETTLAVSAGVRCMAQGGVMHALEHVLEIVGAEAVVVLTGGDYALLESAALQSLELRLHQRHSLVLQGLEHMSHDVDY